MNAINKLKKLFSMQEKNREVEDVFKENERNANILIAKIMLYMFIPLVMVFVLSILQLAWNRRYDPKDIIKIEIGVFIISVIIGFLGLVIPAKICLKRKGKGKYLKFLLISILAITIAIVHTLLTYKANLLLVVPVIIAARYYSKKFTITVAIITTILFIISSYISPYLGMFDLNYVHIPEGTTITIETTLENAIEELNLNASDLIANSALPEFTIYAAVIVLICMQIAHSGQQMVQRQKELSEESARIESELSIAKEIQKNNLPSTFPAFPEHKEFDIYASMTPAKEVGGDFYDMFLLDESHLAVLIADVSGKGVPAALIMMTAKSLIKNTALNENNLENIFNIVNKTLCDGNTSCHFITAWLAILDLKTGFMEFVNAGHNPPLLYSKVENCFNFLIEESNLTLGLLDDIEFKKCEKQLKQGDKLFLYTDGVTEATNSNNELYGEQRLLDYLNTHINQNLTDTINGIKQDIDNFVGSANQFDDITMVELLFKEQS